MPRAVRSDVPEAWRRDGKVFRALADATRRRILHVIGAREMRAGDVADAFPISRPAVSRHLRVLVDAGLLKVRKAGRERWYAIRPEPLAEAAARVQALDAFWRDGLQRLGDHLAAGEDDGG